jgi:hypothetical protein
MKNLLIIGHARSGKSTLADMVSKRYNFSFISTDALFYTFGQILPELGFHEEPEKSEAKLAPFLFMYMDRIAHKSAHFNAVVEGCHVRPKTADAMMNKDKYKMVVLGCASLTPEQFAKQIRDNDQPYDWTAKKDDAELLQIAECFINDAKKLQTECKKVGATFIDTSFDRDEKLKAFVDDLENFLR